MEQLGPEDSYNRAIRDLVPTGGNCLDVGCGTGQLTNYLGLRHDIRVVGFDLSEASLKLAQELNERLAINNTSFVRADLFDHPFKDNSFDVVIANSVLHHTKDTWLALDELTKICKTDGIIIVGLYNAFARWRTNLLRKLAKNIGREAIERIDPMRIRNN